MRKRDVNLMGNANRKDLKPMLEEVRSKVEMPPAGAEEDVVTKKYAKADGAKSGRVRLQKRIHTWTWARKRETEEYAARSRSRMKREYHVRFYRGLGVEYPWSTD